MTSETLAPAPAASTTSAPHPTGRRRRTFAGVKYVLPSFAILLVVMIIPILASLNYSFTAYSVLGSPTWIGADRSEEHTSELQSRGHLVCRLLLEKKNN